MSALSPDICREGEGAMQNVENDQAKLCEHSRDCGRSLPISKGPRMTFKEGAAAACPAGASAPMVPTAVYEVPKTYQDHQGETKNTDFLKK